MIVVVENRSHGTIAPLYYALFLPESNTQMMKDELQCIIQGRSVMRVRIKIGIKIRLNLSSFTREVRNVKRAVKRALCNIGEVSHLKVGKQASANLHVFVKIPIKACLLLYRMGNLAVNSLPTHNKHISIIPSVVSRVLPNFSWPSGYLAENGVFFKIGSSSLVFDD